LDSNECFAERLECASCASSTKATALFGSASAVGVGKTRKVGANRCKEYVAQTGDECFAKNARVATARQCTFNGDERTTGVALAQCFDKFVDCIFGIGDSASGNNAIER
jgi:hypothetical protein